MQIQLLNIGKRFNKEWVFRQCTYQFQSEKSYAIIGYNGSGKSTLLQTIAGAINLSEGQIAYTVQQQKIAPENMHQYISIAAPYIELVEEMTAKEMLQFHFQFKPVIPNITIQSILEIIGLTAAANKEIRHFSSGMKQRIKLAQAIFSDVPILLLDEPCTNLDTTGYQLYQSLISKYCSKKLVIVCSNDEQEYAFCSEKISIQDYK
jgi:ABC-type multidrug transport system ATPase subunit